MTIGILPSVNSVKTNRAVKQEILNCLFSHQKVDEQPNKKPKKGFYSQKIREGDDKNSVIVVKSVSQLGCVSQDSESLESQRGAESPGLQKVVGPIRRVRFTQSTLRQASIKEKSGPSLGKITSQTSSSAKFLRYEI